MAVAWESDSDHEIEDPDDALLAFSDRPNGIAVEAGIETESGAFSWLTQEDHGDDPG
ncbi:MULTISPECIES: hypothetical protein [unclassified Kribbella]|uniref:hypothetical protein n=1 Tax=unclassified Kribbella TaxID=2644121 RepID=UPI0030165E70